MSPVTIIASAREDEGKRHVRKRAAQASAIVSARCKIVDRIAGPACLEDELTDETRCRQQGDRVGRPVASWTARSAWVRAPTRSPAAQAHNALRISPSAQTEGGSPSSQPSVVGGPTGPRDGDISIIESQSPRQSLHPGA